MKNPFEQFMRRTALALAVCVFAAFSAPLQAQTYPTKPIRMYIGFAPGGVADLLARSFGDRMSESLGQTVLVENRPGASGVIALDTLMKSEPDGYTLAILFSTTLIGSLVQGHDIDSDRQLTPIGLAYRSGFFLALNPTLPIFKDVKTVADLVRVVKANPGKVNFASFGVGSTGHLTGELMKSAAGLDWVHIPYKGSTEGYQAVVSGQSPTVVFGSSFETPDKFPGRLVNIAVSSVERHPKSPNVPTLTEGGFAIDGSSWAGVVGPGGMPPAISKRLAAEFKAAFYNPAFSDRLRQILVMEYMDQDDFGKLIRNTLQTWGKVIKDNNIKP